MKKKKNCLSDELKQVCSLRDDGSWELLSTAAGHEPSVKKTLSGLVTLDLLHCTPITVAPSVVRERVLALSVSHPAALGQLFDEWQDLYNQGRIARDDYWLLAAWQEAKECFTQENELDLTAQPWSWYEEFTLFSQKGRLLTRRPLKEKYLTYQDIQAAISQGKGILRALRTQEVKIEEATFFHYSNQIESLDPYILAFLIEFSRKNNFDQNIWIKRFLERIPHEKEPLNLTPSVYCLLNSTWCVP